MEPEIAENGLKMVGNEDDGGGFVEKSNEVFITVKEEPLIILDGDDDAGAESEQPPEPIEGLRENGPPPFLKKTFEMVDDHRTDAVISWSSTRASFVVWDPHKFSTDFLPKHFKHKNFSSFVRQLNTYGFRKIDADRWEFANEGFQQGKKHLLKNIKRKQQNHQRGAQQSSLDSTLHGFEAELEKLRNDQKTLRTEVSTLRQHQETTLHHLNALKQRLHIHETRQNHMVVFVINSLRNPTFFKCFIDKMKRERALGSGGEILKKRRLEVDPMTRILDSGEIDDDDDDKRVRVCEEQTILSEIWPLSSDESGEQKAEIASETNSLTDICSENFVLWEKLMEDAMIYEDEEQGGASKEQYDIVSELENLISSPTRDIVEPLG